MYLEILVFFGVCLPNCRSPRLWDISHRVIGAAGASGGQDRTLFCRLCRGEPSQSAQRRGALCISPPVRSVPMRHCPSPRAQIPQARVRAPAEAGASGGPTPLPPRGWPPAPFRACFGQPPDACVRGTWSGRLPRANG